MTPQQLLDLATARGQQTHTPYRGALTPREAHNLLNGNGTVKLVDVRTRAERDWVGVVDIAPAQHAWVEWNLYPEGTQNPHFMPQLAALAAPEDILLFLCRSGVRSRHAARLASEHGYVNCFDILEGFEGNKDANGHRKTLEGWCQAGLPWRGA